MWEEKKEEMEEEKEEKKGEEKDEKKEEENGDKIQVAILGVMTPPRPDQSPHHQVKEVQCRHH